MQGQHLLLTLLYFGVLSTVTGCYYDPSPYQSRPRPHEHRQYDEGERRQEYDSCFTNSDSYFILQVLCLSTLGIFPIVSWGDPFEGKCRKMLCVALQVIG